MASKAELDYKKKCRLHLLNLPPSTLGEIQEFLTGYHAIDISLDDDGKEAIVESYTGNKVEEAVSKFNGKQFKDNVVKAKAILSRHLICVAHLPLSYTNPQFQTLCRKVGPVKDAFLMVTKTGQSKGYGMVEFDGSHERYINALDGMEVEGQNLHADVVKESVQESFQAMQSRCLLISGLPQAFTDTMHLREMFSCVTSPIYCQILMKGETPLGFGLVEYNTAADTEATWNKMKNQKINEATVKITFCIPGHPAMSINNKIVWAGEKAPTKASLLIDPVKDATPMIKTHGIFVLLKEKIPNFETDFTKVLEEVHKGYLDQKLVPVEKPGLLGPAPALPMSPMMSPNIQIGLAVFIAMTIHKTKGEPFYGRLALLNTLCDLDSNISVSKPSILGDPFTGQANVLFCSLRQQLDEGFEAEKDVTFGPDNNVEERLNKNREKFTKNAQSLNTKYLGNLGEFIGTLFQLPPDFPPKLPGSGLLETPSGPGSASAKIPSLLGPVPDQGFNPFMGNNDMNEFGRGPPRFNERRGPPSSARIPSLFGETSLSKMLMHLQQMQEHQQDMSNQAIVQAMGLGIGSSGMNSLNQTLLGQISKGLMNQIGQNLNTQKSSKDNRKGSGLGLLGEVPFGGKTDRAIGGRSLLGEPPKKNSQRGQMKQDQGSWKNFDDRWGSSGYESGYNNKPSMGGFDYGCGDYGDSYNQDMNSGYSGGYDDNNDYYNNYQYSSNFGSGGYGGDGYGMDSTGFSNNQASGVNYQDGSYGKGAKNSGLGQDSGDFGGNDGFGMSGSGGGGLMGGYSGNYSQMGKGGMEDNNYYDPYNMGSGFGNGSMGMGNNMNNTMGNNMNSGMGNNMNSMGNNMNSMGNNMNSGMGNTVSSGMGNTVSSGMGNNMNSGMGKATGKGVGKNTGRGILKNKPSGGGGAGLLGSGENNMSGNMGFNMGGSMGNDMAGGMLNNTDSGMGNNFGSGNMNSGFGNMGAGMGMTGGNNMEGYGMGYGNDSNNQTGSYSSGMGSNNYNSGGSMLGSGRGLMDNYSGDVGPFGFNNSYGANNYGTGAGNKSMSGNQTGMGASGSSVGNTGGLLPSPGDMNMAGNKRGYNQMLPKMDTSTDMGYSSQVGGQFDSYKRSRMY